MHTTEDFFEPFEFDPELNVIDIIAPFGEVPAVLTSGVTLNGPALEAGEITESRAEDLLELPNKLLENIDQEDRKVVVTVKPNHAFARPDELERHKPIESLTFSGILGSLVVRPDFDTNNFNAGHYIYAFISRIDSEGIGAPTAHIKMSGLEKIETPVENEISTMKTHQEQQNERGGMEESFWHTVDAQYEESMRTESTPTRLIDMAEGLVVRMEWFSDLDEALFSMSQELSATDPYSQDVYDSLAQAREEEFVANFDSCTFLRNPEDNESIRQTDVYFEGYFHSFDLDAEGQVHILLQPEDLSTEEQSIIELDGNELMAVSLEDFRRMVNDQHGHPYGDEHMNRLAAPDDR